MRNWNGWWIMAIIMIAIDFYVFLTIKSVSQNNSEKLRISLFSIYWIVSGAAVLTIIFFPYIKYFQTHIVARNYVFTIIVALFFAKVIACLFFLIDDLRRGILWLMATLFPKTGADFVSQGKNLTRSAFLSWMGLAAGAGLFGSLLYGFSNKYNYTVRTIRLKFPHLPNAFRGMKILQVSDIHSGSFTNKEAVRRGVELIMAQKADLILFTGDLVNDKASEMENYMDLFSLFKAPMGVYSILGNHDYGDYTSWPSKQAKEDNLEKLKDVEAKLGWKLLMNEHVVLEKNGDKIALLGIENWSAFGSFPKYGKLEQAYAGTEEYPFKILMSHDPSHWDAQIRPEYPAIDLTLSGHTHGMQFGVENPYFKWSPVQWFYKEWAGLYQEGQQVLYVNRGFGFIGYPGRVGILPEITVIELE